MAANFFPVDGSILFEISIPKTLISSAQAGRVGLNQLSCNLVRIDEVGPFFFQHLRTRSSFRLRPLLLIQRRTFFDASFHLNLRRFGEP